MAATPSVDAPRIYWQVKGAIETFQLQGEAWKREIGRQIGALAA